MKSAGTWTRYGTATSVRSPEIYDMHAFLPWPANIRLRITPGTRSILTGIAFSRRRAGLANRLCATPSFDAIP